MTKTKTQPYDPFARPEPTEDEKVQLGDLGTFVLKEMSHGVVSQFDDLQSRADLEGEDTGIGELAPLLADMLDTVLERVDGEPFDLAAALKDGYAADKVTLQGLTRAVQHVSKLIAGEAAQGN